MAESVLDPNEISLNGQRYRFVGQVQRSLVSNYPPKQVIGEWTQESDPNLSTLTLASHRGGIGKFKIRAGEPTDRSWYSTWALRYEDGLILPPLVTATTSLPTGATQFRAPVEFKGALYVWMDATAAGDDGVYSTTGSAWGTVLFNVSTAFTDGVSGDIGGTDTLVFCDGSNYYYSTTGAAASFTTDPQNATYLVIWDDKLFGIDAATGQLWYVTAAGGTVVNDAKLILGRAAELTGLFVGPDAAGKPIIYAVTSRGLYVHDFDNGKFYRITAFDVSNKTTASYTAKACACVWRNKIYYSSESTLWEYDVVGRGVRPIGPDVDGGLPAGGSLIIGLQQSINELIAIVAGNGASLASFLSGWDGQGWQVLASLGQTTGPFIIKVAGATGNYRLWYFDDDANVAKYLGLPSDLVNPLRTTSYPYADAATHDWPWFVPDAPGVAVRVKVETINPTTSETVKVYYALNYGSTFQLMTNAAFTDGTINATGEYTFLFPSVNSYVSTTAFVGTAFRAIQFRVVGANSTNTNTPQVVKLTLKYYTKLDPKYQFVVTLDMDGGYGSFSEKQLQDALLTAQETSTMVEFTYRDSGSDTDATFYVQVRPQVAAQNSGRNYGGKTQLLLVEM